MRRILDTAFEKKFFGGEGVELLADDIVRHGVWSLARITREQKQLATIQSIFQQATDYVVPKHRGITFEDDVVPESRIFFTGALVAIRGLQLCAENRQLQVLEVAMALQLPKPNEPDADEAHSNHLIGSLLMDMGARGFEDEASAYHGVYDSIEPSLSRDIRHQIYAKAGFGLVFERVRRAVTLDAMREAAEQAAVLEKIEQSMGETAWDSILTEFEKGD